MPRLPLFVFCLLLPCVAQAASLTTEDIIGNPFKKAAVPFAFAPVGDLDLPDTRGKTRKKHDVFEIVRLRQAEPALFSAATAPGQQKSKKPKGYNVPVTLPFENNDKRNGVGPQRNPHATSTPISAVPLPPSIFPMLGLLGLYLLRGSGFHRLPIRKYQRSFSGFASLRLR